MKFSSNSVFVILGEPGADSGARESRDGPKKKQLAEKSQGSAPGSPRMYFCLPALFPL